MKIPSTIVSVAIAVSCLILSAHGQSSPSIPIDQLGSEVQKQCGNDIGSIVPIPGGAKLKAVMQDLDAEVTADGLWLTSTADEDAGKPSRFRVRAMALGRTSETVLPPSGTVQTFPDFAAFVRPGLVEEYRVTSDGVRQDFVIPERPPGPEPLHLDLDITGARAETAGYGAKLTVAGTGRELAYWRLLVTDTNRTELPARMEVLSPGRLRLTVDDGAAVYPVRIDPTFSDDDWVSMGLPPGTNGTVSAVAVDDSANLYVAGQFTTAGGAVANNIAKWNGSAWSSLGSGVSGNNPFVGALAVSGGDLYVGGRFTTAGGVPTNSIAKWNGSVWSPLGSGVSGTFPVVQALAVIGGNVYAGGIFTYAGGVTANGIAKWNGSSWSALGSGVSGSNSIVRALAVIGGDLYAGGEFLTVGGVTAYNIAKWNGSAWSAVGSPTGTSGGVFTLATSGSDLFAGGRFTTAGGVSANFIAKWNGTAWSAFGSGVNGSNPYVTALAASGGNLYAGGYFTTAGGTTVNGIAKWNGSSWSALGSGVGSGSFVYGLVLIGTDVYAGGTFPTAGGTAAHGVAKWNGSAWSKLVEPGATLGLSGGTVSALAAGGGNVYAGGTFTTAGEVVANGIAKWNGSEWSALGTGMGGNTIDVRALAVNGGDLYAGGIFTSASGLTVNGIAKWNGSAWSALGSGIGSGDVAALAMSGSELYVGGSFNSAGGISVASVARWNGTSWSALGSGVNGRVIALAVSGGDLYSGGSFSTAGGVTVNGIAKWNGSAWSSLGSGVSGGDPSVYALASNGGDLYVGGGFLVAGGVTVNRIAKWNGSAWSALGTGMAGGNPYVYALAVAGVDVYAGGFFTTAGGVVVSNIANWNGSTWSSLGSGVNGGVKALVSGAGGLYSGGYFGLAGGKTSNYLAKLVLSPSSLPSFAVEQPAGSPLSSGTSTVQFGTAALGSGSSRTFAIRNTGDVNLTGIAASENGAEFSISPVPLATLAVGGSAVFTVNFYPVATGTRNAVLSISTNETAAPFAISLTGQGVTAAQALNTAITASGLTGPNALPLTIPFNDGVENLLKYAFNMNLSGADSHALIPGTGNSGLPSIGLTGTGPATMIRVEFLRRKGSGLVYTPKRSSTLQPGSFVPISATPVVTSINDTWERVVVQESANPATLPASFAIVEVALP